MKVKLFIEPKGKAREQVQLESCIPGDMELFRKWKTSWIPTKEMKKLNKEVWIERNLGKYRLGKIVEAVDLEQSQPLKGQLIAYRSYVNDNTGAKKKLPMILVARLKKVLDFKYFGDKMILDHEQEKEMRDALKQDVWGPISIYQVQTVDRKFVVDIENALSQAIQYLDAIFNRNPESAGLPTFIETEILKN